MKDNNYNDFLEDIKIPREDRFFCNSCKQWIPKVSPTHTCPIANPNLAGWGTRSRARGIKLRLNLDLFKFRIWIKSKIKRLLS